MGKSDLSVPYWNLSQLAPEVAQRAVVPLVQTLKDVHHGGSSPAGHGVLDQLLLGDSWLSEYIADQVCYLSPRDSDVVLRSGCSWSCWLSGVVDRGTATKMSQILP